MFGLGLGRGCNSPAYTTRLGNDPGHAVLWDFEPSRAWTKTVIPGASDQRRDLG
jgi:hypothetical protein